MFQSQLQLYVLAIQSCFNTLRRIQKPLGESPHFVSLSIPFLVKATKKVSFISFIESLYSDWSEWAIHWSVALAKIDLVSLYFRFLWYYSILKVQLIKIVKSSHLWLVLVGFHGIQIFPDHTSRAWNVEAGKSGKTYVSVSVSSVGVGSQISPRRAKRDSRSVKCPAPGPTKTINQSPHALPSLLCRVYIDIPWGRVRGLWNNKGLN